jgi:hypothetical protein
VWVSVVTSKDQNKIRHIIFGVGPGIPNATEIRLRSLDAAVKHMNSFSHYAFLLGRTFKHKRHREREGKMMKNDTAEIYKTK